MSATYIATIPLADEGHDNACAVATAMSVPIALCLAGLDGDQRLAFWHGLFATLSGMAEASLGHSTSRAVLESVATLKPAGPSVAH